LNLPGHVSGSQDQIAESRLLSITVGEKACLNKRHRLWPTLIAFLLRVLAAQPLAVVFAPNYSSIITEKYRREIEAMSLREFNHDKFREGWTRRAPLTP
jgi:hypothetical protein